MRNSELLPSLLFKINENQLALEAVIMELTVWAEKLGATEVPDNVAARSRRSKGTKSSSR